MRCGARVYTSLVLVGVVAGFIGCGADDAVRAEVVAYAVGDWRCEIPVTGDDASLFGSAIEIEATVRAEGDDHGEVEFNMLGLAARHEPFTGTWRLDGTDLDVEIPDELATSYHMRGVDIDTGHLEIVEDAQGAETQAVDVARDGDVVEFGWADPWSGDPTAMSCTKA